MYQQLVSGTSRHLVRSVLGPSNGTFGDCISSESCWA